MLVFRGCPSYPGYSAALCGAVRREAWVSKTKLGRPCHRPARLLRPSGPGRAYVYVHGVPVRRERLVADAWPPATRTLRAWLTPSGDQARSGGQAAECAAMLAAEVGDQAEPLADRRAVEAAGGQWRQAKIGRVHRPSMPRPS